MKKILLLLLLGTFISCNNENTDLELETPLEGSNLIVTAHYKGNSYEIPFNVDESGEIQLASDLPDALSNLDDIEELAVVEEGDTVFFFDNEREKFEYFNLNYDELLQSREKLLNSLKNISTNKVNATNLSVINDFNTYVGAYEAGNFRQRRMRMNSLADFGDFRRPGFNDIMSSVEIESCYVLGTCGTPSSRRSIIFYEAGFFRGRSWEASRSRIPGRIEFGSADLSRVRFGGFIGFFTRSFNDRFSSVDIVVSGRSQIR